VFTVDRCIAGTLLSNAQKMVRGLWQRRFFHHALHKPQSKHSHYGRSGKSRVLCVVPENTQDFNTGKTSPEEKFKKREGNDQKNDIITHWACATREILFRIAQGLDIETGLDTIG